MRSGINFQFPHSVFVQIRFIGIGQGELCIPFLPGHDLQNKTIITKKLNFLISAMASLDGHPTRKRLKISLEPIHAPQIDFICPDGSVVELPPTYTDPAVLFARQVCYQSNFGIMFRLCPLWYRWIGWSQKTRKKTKNRNYLQASRKRNPSHLCGKLLWITYAMLRFNVANYPRSLGCCQGSSYIFAICYVLFYESRADATPRKERSRDLSCCLQPQKDISTLHFAVCKARFSILLQHVPDF